jgi:hypothetical protein
LFEWKAKWIWIRDNGELKTLKNIYLCARRVFYVPEDVKAANLRITADARYFLFVNGKRVGNGPIRGWQHSWFYDAYDLTPYLQAGVQNVLAVLVWQPGETTFQYPLGRGGLLAQLDIVTNGGQEITVATDRNWLVKTSEAYDQRTPRISVQQGFVEHYDAKKDLGWTAQPFDDSNWTHATELGDVGVEPWKRLVPRPIPFLTSEPSYPVRVARVRVVKPPRIVHSFDLRPNFLEGDRLSNVHEITGIALTVVRVPEAREVKVTILSGAWLATHNIRVNGEDVSSVDRNTATLRLNKGENLVAFDVTASYHDWWFTTVWDADLEFKSPTGKEGVIWVTAGPFSSREEEGFRLVWGSKSPEDIKASPHVKPVSSEHEASDNAFARVVFSRELEEKARVENIGALCLPNEEIASIYPAEQGDVELLIDFGREVVGFLDFELSAPKDVVLDFYGFEAMHPRDDGGFDVQHTFGLNNVLRYRTREGWQSYTSVVRRGYRYLVLTARFPRGERTPLRIKFVRCLLNTYPYEELGDFVCNDWELNEIWRMCRYTLRLCSEDTYVDCPAYEQTFWVGDARNEALVAYATYGGYQLARRCWLLAGESLFRSPLVESQVPSGWQNVLTAWSLLWVWACEEYYRYTGDEEFLREVYPYIAKQMYNIAERFIRADGLFEIEAWNMLDWAPMDTPGAGVVSHQNAMLVEAYRRSAKMARWLGKEDDAVRFEALAERVKQAINEHLWDDKRGAYVDSIHADGKRSDTFSVQTQTIIYLCDAATEARKRIIRDHIYGRPDNFVWFGSPFALFFLMEAYAEDGEVQRILDLVRREWGAMIDYGATTAWETLSPQTRSHCHAWSAGPAFFLSSYVLGIRMKETGECGVKKVLVAPEPSDLKWARGRFPTKGGEVSVRWEKADREFTIWLALPCASSGDVVLPSIVPEKAKIIVQSTKSYLGPSFEDGRWNLRLESGAQAQIKASW